MDLINEGNKIKVEPESSKRVEFYLKPNVFGEVPVKVEIGRKDHLDLNS